MANKFKCCKKDFNNYICTSCSNVYHPSCKDRIKNIEIISGTYIYCSEKCKHKDKNLTEELSRLIAEVEEKKTELVKKDLVIEETENKFTEIIEQLQEQNNKLLIEIREKDLYIERVQRRTRDFEDEVYEEERKYEAECTKQKQTIAKLSKELVNLESKIAVLQAEIESQNDIYTDIMTEYKEIQEINKKMLISIETLEAERQMLRNEINELNRKSIYPDRRNKCEKKNMHVKFAVKHQEDIKTNVPMIEKRGKVKFITNSQGKHLGKQLFRLLGDAYSIESTVKSNADEEELVRSALKNAEQLTKNDFLILWPNKCSKQLVQRILNPLKNIQTIIITEPYYKFNYKNINDIIYYRNLELKKEASRANLGQNIVDCNGSIRRNNYTRHGNQINETGKYYLGISIRSWIHNRSIKVVNKCDSSEQKISTNILLYENGLNLETAEDPESFNGSDLNTTPSLAEQMMQTKNGDNILDISIINRASNKRNFQNVISTKAHR